MHQQNRGANAERARAFLEMNRADQRAAIAEAAIVRTKDGLAKLLDKVQADKALTGMEVPIKVLIEDLKKVQISNNVTKAAAKAS